MTTPEIAATELREVADRAMDAIAEHHVAPLTLADVNVLDRAAALLERLSASEEVTEAMLSAGRAAWQSAMKDRNLDQWLARIYLDMRSAQQNEDQANEQG